MKYYVYVEYIEGKIGYSSAFDSFRRACEVMVHYINLNNPVHKNFWIESEKD